MPDSSPPAGELADNRDAPGPVAAPHAGDAPAHRERIGILGGTFDPPHRGHVSAARAVLSELALDRVLLVVANDPWQKAPTRAITPARDRLAMVQAAVAGVDGIAATSIEIERGGPTYTVDTVEHILASAAHSDNDAPELFLVIGADLVDNLETWHRVDELRGLVTLAIVSRPGEDRRPADPAGWRTVHVEGEGVAVSSSEVRDRIERGLPVDGMIPDPVLAYIRSRGLYGTERANIA